MLRPQDSRGDDKPAEPAELVEPAQPKPAETAS